MLTQERLKEVLNYDADTGVFTWAIKRTNSVYIGKVAGSPQIGYISIRIDNKLYLAHRLAWLYVYGYFPKNHTDHINNIRDDNRICNLREATAAENLQNYPATRKNSKTGMIGVSKKRKKYRARLMLNRKEIYLGVFDTPEEAQAAYISAKEKLHPFFVSGRI